MLQSHSIRQCQRILDSHIEQVKCVQHNKKYMKLPKYDKESTNISSTAGLIAIQRLPIPHKAKENVPLVEYWHSENESEDETTLFPISNIRDSTKYKQDLTDTFSIEELSNESEDSLHLGTPQYSHPLIETYKPTGCFSCQCHIL
ncbi:uncharacterized protein [Prorops nasuta]